MKPTVMPHHIQPEETNVFLMKKERELNEEVTSIKKQLETKKKELIAVREKLKPRLAAKFEAVALNSAGDTALPQPNESPVAAYNLRLPGSSSASEKKGDVLKLQIEMDLSPLLATPMRPWTHLTSNSPLLNPRRRVQSSRIIRGTVQRFNRQAL